MAIDGWSNIRSNKVTNILLISTGVPYFYKSIENENNSNTSEYLLPLIENMLLNLINDGLNIIALTTDNENLMKNIRTSINKKNPLIIIAPCSAHIIQLCYKKILSISTIKLIVDNTYQLITKFKNNKENKNKLFNLQIKDDIKEPLHLIFPTEIRWSTLIIAIERIIYLKKYIDDIIQVNEYYWEDLNSFYMYTKIFKKSTDLIQKNNATIYSVWNSFNEICEFYKSSNIPDKFINIAKETEDIIKNKWNKHINNDLIEASRLFNLEQNYKFNKSTINFVIEWGTNYLTTYKIVKNNNIEHIKKLLHYQLNEFIGRQNDFALINSKDKELNDIYNYQGKIYNIKTLWIEFISSYYELSKVAIAILSICPSEACVERSFSIQQDIHTLERNRLKNEFINAEMNIKMNY